MKDFVLFPILAFLIVLLVVLVIQYIREFHGVETDVWGTKSPQLQNSRIIGRKISKSDHSLELLPTQI